MVVLPSRCPLTRLMHFFRVAIICLTWSAVRKGGERFWYLHTRSAKLPHLKSSRCGLVLYPLPTANQSRCAGISWSPSCVTVGASCQIISGSGSGTAIGIGPALRIAPVGGIPFYVAGFEAGWRVSRVRDESGRQLTRWWCRD